MSETAFFQDLAMLMSVAGIVAVVFARFGWPKVLGYILAGIVMSRYTWGGSFLADEGSAKTIGQLGVVFLMFSMGLSFSTRDMAKIKSVALPAAIVDTLVMIWLGYTVGTKFFGWSAVPSMFLGVAICDSATTLLAKVIDEMGWGRRPFTKCVLGTSVCEDIICVGAIAVVTGFAQGGTVSVRELFSSLGWLTVFFLSVLVFGFILLPRLLQSVAKRKDDESLLLAVLGACFFVSFFAYKFNFSLALGAFLVGILGASSAVRDRLSGLVSPLKSMFSAVFFVSIGLMVDPAALFRCLPEILLVSAVVIVGKALNNALVSLAVGLDVKTAVQNGFSLAQIGEFAFMVAILYAGLVNDAENPMFQIAVGVSLLTTLLNPTMIRLSDKAGDWVEGRIPARCRGWLSTYQAWLEKIKASANQPAFALLQAAAIRLGVYAVLMLSVAVGCSLLHRFDYSRFSEFFEQCDEYVFFLVSNLFTLAMMPLIISAARSIGDEVAVLLTGGGNDKWQLSVKQLIRFVTLLAVMGLFFLEWTMLNISVLPISPELQGISIAVIVAAGIVGWRFFTKAGRRATQRFQEALTVEERQTGMVKMLTVSLPEGTIHRLVVAEDSPAVGGTVVSLNIRAKTGASVMAVYRDEVIHRNIGPEWTFQAGDVLVSIGDGNQIAALKGLLEPTVKKEKTEQ